MLNYLYAENIKFRRTFTKKLVFLMPLGTLMLTLLLAINFFQADAFNWWYALIMPGYIALIAALCDQKDSKKLGYRAVVALPVSLKKVWIAKIINLVFYFLISNIVILVGALLGSFVVPKPMPVGACIVGTLLIFLTSLWMIPLCLFLSKKVGMVATLIINVVACVVLGIYCVNKPFWIACPFCYPMRVSIPALGVLPNGTLAAAGDPLLNASCILPACILSLVLFFVITAITTVWFSKKEAN